MFAKFENCALACIYLLIFLFRDPEEEPEAPHNARAGRGFADHLAQPYSVIDQETELPKGKQSCQVPIASGQQSSADTRTEVSDSNPHFSQKTMDLSWSLLFCAASCGCLSLILCYIPQAQCLAQGRCYNKLLLLLYIPAALVPNQLSSHSLIKYFQVIKMNTGCSQIKYRSSQ